jgi:predicted dehydrogenase
MNRISRRRFLEDSAALLAASAVPVAALAENPARRRHISPNEKIHVAVIGLNSRGMNHVDSYLGYDDVELVAVCDPDTATFAKALKSAEKAGKKAPATVVDIRKLLEDKTIDAVSIATPNHWHSLAAIWAMQAGKDVYCEKPVSHNVSEGRRIVEVARKLDKICQCGTQSRASRGLQEAMAFLHDGKLGEITLARGLCYKRRKSIGKTEGPQHVPDTANYDLWLGPAPMKPLRRANFHYDWHWQWDYGNGDLGNQGIHEMDKARWGLGQPGLPSHVAAVGGRFGNEDDGETPNTLIAAYDYGDQQIIFEVRGLETEKLAPVKGGPGAGVGNIFYGEKGVMVMPSYSEATAYDNDGNKIADFKGGGDHFRNFLDATRSRKRSDLFAEIEEGHLSSALCHLGNVSYVLGEEAPFNGKTKAFGDNKEAYETFGRFEEHLAANGVSIKEGKYRVGKRLAFDSAKEKFVGDSHANHLLTREYRKGFEVPAKA